MLGMRLLHDYSNKLAFKHWGTTSAGIAHSLGYIEPEKISREEMLSVIKQLLMQFQFLLPPILKQLCNEYTRYSRNNSRAIEIGVVGVNIEDSPGENNKSLMDIQQQVERLKLRVRQPIKLISPYY